MLLRRKNASFATRLRLFDYQDRQQSHGLWGPLLLNTYRRLRNTSPPPAPPRFQGSGHLRMFSRLATRMLARHPGGIHPRAAHKQLETPHLTLGRDARGAEVRLRIRVRVPAAADGRTLCAMPRTDKMLWVALALGKNYLREIVPRMMYVLLEVSGVRACDIGK